MNHIALGLDLRKATMPEAIAAMVEAWLKAQEVQGEGEPGKAKEENLPGMVSIRYWKTKNGVMPQTATALIGLSGLKPVIVKKINPEGYPYFDDCFSTKEIQVLDALLHRLRSGESMAKLKREAMQKHKNLPQ